MFANAIHPNTRPTPVAQQVLAQVDQKLKATQHFARHTHCLQIDLNRGRLVVSGRVPSFYLKSVVQEVLSQVEGVKLIDNRVEVVSCAGLSSEPSGVYKAVGTQPKGDQP